MPDGHTVAPAAAADRPGEDRPLALAQPDWLQSTLTVTGPAETVEDFRQAAAGAGVVPWVTDYDRLEEDWFHLLLAAPPHLRPISVQGARILARRLREATWSRHEEATALVGVSRACPFDLHRLVPVPAEILRLGDDHPRAQAWLWANWGTTWPLRRVALLGPPSASPAALPPGSPAAAAFRVQFWSADWTPWPALLRLRARWPGLVFDCRPAYGDDPGGGPAGATARPHAAGRPPLSAAPTFAST